MGSMQRRIGPNKVGQQRGFKSNQINNNNNNFNKHPTIIKLLAINGRSYSTKSLTKVERNSFSVPPHLDEVLIGAVLGDTILANLQKRMQD